MSEESKRKMSLVRVGKLVGEKNPMYGKHHSTQTREKMRLARKGRKPNLGHKHSEETKKKIGLACKGYKHSEVAKRNIGLAKLDEKHPLWKGNNVGRPALHGWVRSRLPKPQVCEFCNQVKKLDLANISGFYNRRFINWKYLCRLCHNRLDINASPQ